MNDKDKSSLCYEKELSLGSNMFSQSEKYPPIEPCGFKRVRLDDREALEAKLLVSKEQTCEFNFVNLYIWGFTYRTHWQEYNNRIYLYLLDENEKHDELMFTTNAELNDEPEIEELIAVSDSMIHAGFSGSFQHIRKDYIESHDGLEKYFEIEPIEDSFSEYIYSVESLAELSGSKLSKKRNLISQFKRDYPDHCTRLIDDSNLHECIELSGKWRETQPEPDSLKLQQETDALRHLMDNFKRLDIIGLAAYADGKMVAYEMCSRINADMFTEHFEKSLYGYKGASQYINNETAKFLIGKCKYLNREQDLGSEGLRQAKMSYMPLFLLQNYRLIRKK